MNVHEGERRLKHGRQELLADPAEREARERNAELGRGKIGVEMRANMLRESRAEISLVY